MCSIRIEKAFAPETWNTENKSIKLISGCQPWRLISHQPHQEAKEQLTCNDWERWGPPVDWLRGAGKGALLSLSLLKMCFVCTRHRGLPLLWRKWAVRCPGPGVQLPASPALASTCRSYSFELKDAWTTDCDILILWPLSHQAREELLGSGDVEEAFIESAIHRMTRPEGNFGKSYPKRELRESRPHTPQIISNSGSFMFPC